MFTRRAFHLASFTALLAVLTSTSSALAGQQDKLDRALAQGKSSSSSQLVIVEPLPGYSEWVRVLLAHRGKLSEELSGNGSLTAELSAADLEALCEMSTAVRMCHSDAEVKPDASLTPSSSGQPTSSLLATLGLRNDATLGRGVTVAVIDSGLYASSAFAGRVKAFRDFTGTNALSVVPFDDYGHGTHVAGLIGGMQSPGDVAFQGVAPGVSFVILKVLDKNGAGKTSDVIRAIEFAVANKSRLGIDMINLSLGHPPYEQPETDPLVRAVEKASAAGIIVVASAGNHGMNAEGEQGYGGITVPGNAPSVLTVGAADHQDTVSRNDDRVAPYSSSGPTWYEGLAKPDFMAPGPWLGSEAAPGSSLYKTYPQFRTKGPSGKTFMQLSATSMAAAGATGVVSVL